MADNEGIQIKEILAKADGGCPRREDFEAAYNGYVFGPDGKAKERPNVYIAEKLRFTNLYIYQIVDDMRQTKIFYTISGGS